MEIKKTITSIFMIPTLKIPKNQLKDNGFINGYIKDVDKDVQYEDAVYLLFQPKNIDKFREFLDAEYERTKNIIEDYDYEGGYVVIVYQLNIKFKKDYELVKKGCYSKTSLDFQKLFPKHVDILVNNINKQHLSLQYRIFNKTEDLVKFWENKLGVVFEKEYEVWNGFEEEKEILNIKNIK
jgi:hypothetical protein